MAQKLSGVVSGLQVLEDNFLKVLMEAALKLASLTDVPVLILCEAQGGRRFAGQRELCELYRNGTLLPTKTDVEMVIDLGHSELREKPEDGVDESVYEVVDDNPTTNKSSFCIDDADIIPLTMTENRKRSSDDGSLSSWTPALKSGAKRSRKSAPAHPPHFRNLSTGKTSSDCLETPPLPQMTLDDQWNWDHGVDVKAFPSELDDDDVGHETNGSGNSSTHLERLDQIVERWRPNQRTSTNVTSFPAISASPDTSVVALAENENGGGCSNFDLKIEALKKISGHKFEQTNSDEFRLMSSCMYEFGRNTAENYLERLDHAPGLPHRRFFVQRYELWAAQFSNIHPFGNVMIKKENRESKRTLTAYMRKIAGDAFGICIRKRMKKLNEHQMKNFEYSNGQIANHGQMNGPLTIEPNETYS